MGLFDEVMFRDKCPYCKTWQTFNVQTKAFKGRGCSQYVYTGDPKYFFSKNHKNDKIPVHDFDPETSAGREAKKHARITGTTHCSSPYCLWYSLRADIMEDAERPIPRSFGRWLNAKIPFNKKSGELQKPTFTLSPQVSEEVLQKALKTLFYHDPEGVKKAAKEANYEPLLILLQYERNYLCPPYKPKSETHTTKKKASTSQHTTSKA